MDKIIRASNLQKALEDYDSLKGQPVIFVDTLPESPNIRTRVYCKQNVTTITELFDLKIEGLVEEFMDEYAAGQYIIKSGYTVRYHNTNVGSVEINQGTVTLYEDQFTTALTDSFNLTDKYTFDVTLTVTEMAYYMGDGTNQSLYPVVTFGVIEEVKSRVEKVYNVLDNRIDDLAENFVTDSLTVNNAIIDNAQVNNLDVSTLIANSSSGSDGQYLGKNNGSIEWVTPPFDTNHLYVNHITVNNNASIDNLGVNNVNVNGNTNINGDSFKHKGLDVTSMTVISEADYNNLGWEYRNSALYMTYPNGNMYFCGVKYAATSMTKEYNAYVDLPNMASSMQTLTTSTLTFTPGAVTNSFVNGGAYNGIKERTPFETYWNNSAPVGTQANDGNILTNAKELYITNAARMYTSCSNLTDTFICNPSLISGAPASYDPMKYCKDMDGTFSGCSNFNQPVTIPDGVTDMGSTFSGCSNLNQPITIPDSVTDMDYTFYSCGNFNQPVIISNSVASLNNTFYGCSNLNQPFTIPDGVTDLGSTFYGCKRLNQPVTIPNSVTNMGNTFRNCSNFNQPVTIPNSVTNVVRTFYNCYNFNQPVTIPDGVTSMGSTFYGCSNLNQPFTIPDGVTDLGSTFWNCSNFNQPVTIPDSVTSMGSTFYNCYNLNQPITLPNNVISLYRTFNGCSTLASSSVPIHISHEIALGNTSNYIYNCLVNGYTGINWTGRILNDA